MLVTQEAEVEDAEIYDKEIQKELDEPVELVSVSLNSVVGFDDPKTMKMKGQVGEEEVVVMIDSGRPLILSQLES